MGTFERLSVGDTVLSTEREISEADIDVFVERGGYTHPLFTDPAFAATSRFGRRPVPGQALLLVMGGLAEQTGAFDGTVIGLTGFDAVRFLAPAFAGDRVHLRIEIVGKDQPRPTRGELVMGWSLMCSEALLVDAVARMRFSL